MVGSPIYDVYRWRMAYTYGASQRGRHYNATGEKAEDGMGEYVREVRTLVAQSQGRDADYLS